MSLAADAFQQFTVKGLTAVQGRFLPKTLPDLIGRQTTLGFDLQFNEDNESILADFRASEAILEAVASDGARFASAAFQTMTRVPLEIAERDTISWSLIRAYYAAFYAGHSIIRLLGESCSFFDREHIARINRLAGALGRVPGFRVDRGAYHCRLNTSATVIECKSLRAVAGGTHEAFWGVFGARLKAIGDDILLGPLAPTDAEVVLSKVDALQQTIAGHGAPFCSWLSVMRNEIQYRHHFGVWFPCNVGKAERQQLSRLALQWKRDPMDIDMGAAKVRPLGEFVSACAFIVSLCRELLVRIAERSTKASRSFATLGPLTCLNDLSAF